MEALSRPPRQVRLNGDVPGGYSIGLCKRSVPSHGFVLCIQMFAGDGTLNVHKGNVIQSVQEGRIKNEAVRDNDVVCVHLDCEEGVVIFSVNDRPWVRISEVKTGEFKVGAGVRARDDGENGARRPLLWPG